MSRRLEHPPDDGQMVNEGDSCPYWERCERDCIAPLEECWFCKWSEFGFEDGQHKTQARCNRKKEVLV